ncbi:hypothetical protein [Chryseobacterium sp. 'Rf worker isolate 10']|uniref:hypothetical protein n=1 Tax=Chryseobacterium sp. 'Rf worker isolate 10' TaxID=2887348 RepID=UPI003D6EC568
MTIPEQNVVIGFKAKINPEGGRDLFFNQINSSFFRSEIIRCKNEVDISFLVFAAEASALPLGITVLRFSWLVCVSPAIILFLLVFLPLILIANLSLIPLQYHPYFHGISYGVFTGVNKILNFINKLYDCNMLINKRICIFKSPL